MIFRRVALPGGFRMQPASTNRIDAVGGLGRAHGRTGLASTASSCESYRQRHCHQHEPVLQLRVLVERTCGLWRGVLLSSKRGIGRYLDPSRGLARAASGSAARRPRAR